MAIDINWWAILVTTIVGFVLGNIWFGPLFGNAYMKIVSGMSMEECKKNFTPEMKKKMWRSMIFVVITSVIMNVVLAHNIAFGSAYLHMTGIPAGLQAGFWNWLGFVAPVSLGGVLFENRPWKHWFILAPYYLIALLINGAILTSWM